MPQIQVSSDTLDRLKVLAEPFVDKEPEDVIRRLLDEHERPSGVSPSSLHTRIKHIDAPSPAVRGAREVSREPRERGTIIELGDCRIQAASVRDLYRQALKFLVDKHGPQLKLALPFKTSEKRYLIAEKPVHPSNNSFVVPVEYRGRYMESHKDYRNGVRHLEHLAKALGISFRVIR